MEMLDAAIVEKLRCMARDCQSPSQMFKILRHLLGSETHILTILHYFRHAFCLDLSEGKPFVALSRGGTGEIYDETFLDQLVMPAIAKHQSEWDMPATE